MLETVTKTNWIDEMPRSYGTLQTTEVKIRHQGSHRPVDRTPTKIDYPIREISEHSTYTSITENALAERKVLRSAPGGLRNIRKNSEVLLRLTGESGGFACRFWTDLHLIMLSVNATLSVCITW
jgi:hypothetical protein